MRVTAANFIGFRCMYCACAFICVAPITRVNNHKLCHLQREVTGAKYTLHNLRMMLSAVITLTNHITITTTTSRLLHSDAVKWYCRFGQPCYLHLHSEMNGAGGGFIGADSLSRLIWSLFRAPFGLMTRFSLHQLDNCCLLSEGNRGQTAIRVLTVAAVALISA